VNDALTEATTQAQHSIQFAVRDLRGTLANASALESIVLMQLIDKAAALNAELNAFATAREMDCPTGGAA